MTQTSHASRSKYLGKTLGNSQEWMHHKCRDLSVYQQCKQWRYLGHVLRMKPGSLLSRWALEQLEEHTNGQTGYYLDCKSLLTLADTEEVWSG